jgi:uncharacterized protein YqgV (UPF0045/DUF77 family)
MILILRRKPGDFILKGACEMTLSSVALQVLPKTSDDKVFGIVDKVIEYIASTGVTYVVGPFETTMEGDLDVLLDIVRESQRICVENGAESVMSYVKIAYKPTGAGTWSIDEKIGKFGNRIR